MSTSNPAAITEKHSLLGFNYQKHKSKNLLSECTTRTRLFQEKESSSAEMAGIEVIVGVLEEECRELNEIFIKYITKKQPFIAIKTATTLDGKIATRTGSSKWITGEESREKVQHLRNSYDAILTSSKTVIEDNPALTCRIQNGRNPIRIILDSELKTSVTAKVFENTSRVIIATKNTHKTKPAYPSFVEFIECPTRNGKIDLSFLAKELYNQKISSVLIEAGGTLNGAFLRENLVDKIYHFIAPKIVGDSAAKNFVNGINILDITNCILTEIQHLSFSGNDVIIEYCVKNKS
jgi:diaminohydroxyphosphoribosylaminopyrimidine deaminase/5-amino-6-(5-phosphoribosylamino)uracil reductase